jgi:hypothetical protein
MFAHYRLSLHAVMRALAVAIVVTFALSAVSIAYAAGRHAAQDDASRSSAGTSGGFRAADSEALG